jgi:hypothetical protein
MTAPVVAVDPLFDPPDGAEAIVEMAHRYGRYRLYAEHERIDIDLGRGLMQRHDSVQAFLRTGGARGPQADLEAAAARTSYFREEYAYDTEARIGGVEAFLHNPGLIEGAVAVHGRPVVEPAIAFANLMIPGQELAVHTDVPEFRGANRKVLPQWLLVVMHHSGLFDRWRLHIATGIAWFREASSPGDGALRYWPEGPDADPVVHPVRRNTALVLDTDSVFHGVDPVSPGIEPPVVSPGAGLVAAGGAGDDDTDGADGAGGPARWVLSDADGSHVATYDWDELRFSVSWKAYCFADGAERAAWRDHTDDLTTEAIVARLVDDLVERDLVAADVAIDRKLGLLMIDEYVRYPGTPTAA